MSTETFQLLGPIIEGFLYLILAFVVFTIGKYMYDKALPFPVDEELTSKDNPAMALTISGYYMGLFVIISGVLMPAAGQAFSAAVTPVALRPVFTWEVIFYDLLTFLVFSLFGILALILSQKINNRLVLSRFDTWEEVLRDRNNGVGAVLFASSVASALFIAVSISEDNGPDLTKILGLDAGSSPAMGISLGLSAAVVSYFLGQILLSLFMGWYSKSNSYDIHTELEEKDNFAAGISFAGCTLAAGVFVVKIMQILYKEPLDWAMGLHLALILFLGLFLIRIVRFFVDRILLPGSRLSQEITRDGNTGAGLVEAVLQLGFAILVFFSL